MAETNPVVIEIRAEVDQMRSELDATQSRFDEFVQDLVDGASSAEEQIAGSSGAISDALKALAATIGISLSVDAFVGLSDAFTTLRNDLAVAGVEGAQLKTVQDALFNSAQKYGVEINSLANLYGSLTSASKDLGATQDQVLKITSAVSASLKIQGTSSEQAGGALLQLGQALGSSTIQAEEFGSLVDGLRPLLQAVAESSDQYGGSVSKLVAAVKEGKVTNQEFFDLILKGSQILEERAAKATLTTAAALSTLNNALIVYFGEADKANGVSAALAIAIKGIADNLYILIPAIATVATGLGVGFVSNAIAAQFAAIRAQSAILSIATTSQVAGVAMRQFGVTMLAALGGPTGIAITAGVVAIVYAITRFNAEAERAARLTANFEAQGRRLKDVLAETDKVARQAASGIAQVGSQAVTSTGQMLSFAGAVGEAAERLKRLAEERRRAKVIALQGELGEASALESDLSARARRLQGNADSTRRLLGFGYQEKQEEAKQAREMAAEAARRRRNIARSIDILGGTPLEKELTGSETEGRDVEGDLERVTRDLVIARKRGLRAQIDSLEAQKFELDQYKKYRKDGLSPAAAAEQARQDRTDYASAAAGAASDRDARAAGKDRSDAEREALQAARADARYSDEIAQSKVEQLRTLADLTGSAQARYEAEIAAIDADEAAYARQVALEKDLSKTKQQALIDAKAAAAAERRTLAEQERAAALAEENFQLTESDLRIQQDVVRIKADAADNSKDRAKLELELLDLSDRLRVAELDRILATERTSSVLYQRAAAEKQALAASRGDREDAVRRQNEGPMARYRRNLNRSGNAVNEDLEQLQVDAIENATDAVAQLGAEYVKLGGIAGRVVNGIIEDLIRLAIKQATISLFGGGEGGTGGGNLFANIGKAIGSLFGGAPGRASGGRVNAGEIYRVNEGAGSGREYFRPDQSGTVIPLGMVNAAAARPAPAQQITLVVQAGEYFDARVAGVSRAVATPIASSAASRAGGASFAASQQSTPATLNKYNQLKG